MSPRNFPLPQPAGDDPRFCFGLTRDVAKVLQAAGYPRIDGVDFVDLQQALFRFLYSGETPAPVAVRIDQAERDLRFAAKVAERLLADMAAGAEGDMCALDEDQPTTSARGHGQDDTAHYAHAMTGEGAETPRCGAAGKVVLFAYAVTCPRCLALLAELLGDDALDEKCRRCGAPFDPADPRFDGHGRWPNSPWCRMCVDNCHVGDAWHSCMICEVTT